MILWDTSGRPQLSRRSVWRVSVFMPRPNYQHSIPETESRGLETEPCSLETELRVHMIHESLEHRLTEDPPQPGWLFTKICQPISKN